MNNKMILTSLTTLLLFVSGNAFAPSPSTPQHITSLNAKLSDQAKVYWANGKSQWEFEQDATYVDPELAGKKPGKAAKKIAKKKSSADSQPYKYQRSVGKVSAIPFGRPKVDVKKSKRVVKKSAPIFAKTAVVDSLFAKASDAAAGVKKPALPKFGKKATPAKKAGGAKPAAAKPAFKNPFAKKEAPPPPAPKKSFSLKGLLKK